MSTETLESLCRVNPEALGAATPMDMEFRYLDISAVTKGRIDWAATQLWKYAHAPSRARRRLRTGDVLLCTVRPGLQAHARIRHENDAPLVGSTGFAVLRPNLDGDSDFIYHQLFGDAVAAQLRALETGSNYPAVNESDLRLVRFFCPDEEERWRIGTVLNTVDDAIAKTEAVIAKLRQVRAGLLFDLLTRGLDHNGKLRDPIAHPEQFKDSPLGQIPKEWDVYLLDDVAIRGSGHTPSKDVFSYWNGGIKWVSLADSDKLDRIYISETDKEISELGIENSSAVKHPAGTVIISRDAGIGKSAILAREMAVSQHFMAWRCGKRLHNVYLYYWLQHNKRQASCLLALQWFPCWLFWWLQNSIS